jgi:hypothetical protein
MCKNYDRTVVVISGKNGVRCSITHWRLDRKSGESVSKTKHYRVNKHRAEELEFFFAHSIVRQPYIAVGFDRITVATTVLAGQHV